jgi:hypothetical protein
LGHPRANRLPSIRGRAHSRSCLSITFESGGSFSSEADDALVDTIVLSEPGLVDRLLAEDQPRPTREERDRELEQLRTEIADAEREQQRRTARARRAQLESELATLVEVEGD